MTAAIRTGSNPWNLAQGRVPTLGTALLAGALACTAASAEAPRPNLPPEEAARFRLAWSDEFNADSVDETKWDYRLGPAWWSTQQKQNIVQTGGSMRIELKKESALGMAYTAGGLISKPQFRYGYYEARFRCPPGKGWHTSFWLMNRNGVEQEIDICENDSINPMRYSVNTHRYNPIHTSVGFRIVETPDLSADFHVWGCEFTPRKVTYYFEGKPVASFPVDRMAHNDHNIWLTSLAASLAGTDRVDDDKLPAAAIYDYVRVFEPISPYGLPTNAPASAQPGPPVSAFGLDELHARGGLPNVAARIAATGEVRIAYLGGSITEANGWRNYTREFLRKKYPKARFTEIHAAISGTGSDFGACRLGPDVLEKKPDLLFVEFAVNDGGANPQRIARAMEGIVRQTWRTHPETDLCFVYTLAAADVKTLQSGKFQRSASAMESVAEHYGIPSLHFGVEVARLEKDGQLHFTGKLPTNDQEREALGNKLVFSGDGTHPHHETGHLLYVESFVRAWPLLAANAEKKPHALPAPLDPANWEQARALPVESLARTGEWKRLERGAPQIGSANVSGRIQGRLETALPWTALEPGAALAFRFKGRALGLAGLKGPDAGNFRVTVDDHMPVTDALFDAWCVPGRWRIKPWFYPKELADGEHTVRIELIEGAPDKVKALKAKDASGLEGAVLHLSDVLLVGELVP